MTEKSEIDMNKIKRASREYIQGWQARAAGQASQQFETLDIGTPFTLPGGTLRQVKVSSGAAWAGSKYVPYQPWERVVPVQ